VRNQLTSETQTLSGQAGKVVSYDYDADGLRVEMNSPSGSPVDYTWTAKGQLDDISRDGPPPLATYTYDKAGRLDQLAHENGITQDLSHDAAGQLLSRIHKKSGTTVSGHNYVDNAGNGIDSTGRRTLETFSDGTTPDRTYGYDNADQVTSATYDTGISDAYNYDAMGNRTTATLAINSGATTTYTANNVNQYTVISGFSAPVHDANGNLTFQNGITYTWDSENRLLSITDGTTTNTYTYDGQHRRVTKRTTVSGTVTNKVHYLYDGWNVIEERTNTDTTTTFTLSTFSLTRTLTWGTDLSGSLQGAGGVGGLLMAEEITSTTTTAYHYHFDGNGNVTEVTDASGNSAATYRYDAFGNTLIATGPYAVTNKYRFSTKPLDAEIATAPLYYYGYRYYDPITGRWPSRDPIEEKGGVNVYGFVVNSPVGSTDYLGKYTINDAWKKLVEAGVEPTGPPDPLDPPGGGNQYSSKQLFDKWYELEKTRGNWWTVLPKCPKKLCLKDGEPVNPDDEKWKDPGKPSNAEELLHKGTDWSLRSKPVNGHSNQCTYEEIEGDADFVHLLTTPPGSGTVDYRKPGANFSHYNHDVDPVFRAARADGQTISLGNGELNATATVMKYYEVRPLWAED
jgi:RHS repeat-associated protein